MDEGQFRGLGNITTIRSESVTAVIDSLGAKCLALIFSDENQLFYDAEDIGHSGIPICFPSFGPLDDQTFVHGGKNWPMKQHGFVRNLELPLASKTGDSVTYRLSQNEETLSRYPFNFEFAITHQIIDAGLKIQITVSNHSDNAMPISPGIHPYFAVEDPDCVTVTTAAEFGHNNLNNYVKERLADSEYFEVVKESDGVKTLKLFANPDQHIIDHGLETTRLTRGDQFPVNISADPAVFKMMTVWRKHNDSAFVCVEPANFKNALNSQPLLIPPGDTLQTEISMQFG